MAAGGIVEIEVVPDLKQFPGKLQSGLQSTTGIASTLGRNIGLAITAGTLAAAAGFAQVIKLGAEYENTLNSIQGVTGATGAQMAAVSAKTKELGSDLELSGVSAADAAGAILELSKGGLTLEEAMIAAKGALALAGAAQIDGARAAEIQTQTLNQFNLSANEAGRVADVLANTANLAAGGVEDIGLAMKYVGPVAASMGISLEDTATSVGILANNGIMADTAGTSLRGMLVSLSAPSNAAQKGLDALGITAFDSQGKFVGLRSVFDQLQAAQGRMTDQQFQANAAIAFGREPLAAINALAKGGGEAFDEFSRSLANAPGALALSKAQMQGLSGAMEGFKSTLETVAISIYEIIKGPLEQLTRGATAGLDVLNDVLAGKGLSSSGLSSVFDTAGKILTNLKVAAEPVVTGIRAIWDSLNSGGAATGLATTGLQLFVGALELASRLLGPIGSGVGALLQVFSLLPGPVQAAVFALLALKTVPGVLGGLSKGLRGVTDDAEGAAGSTSRFARGLSAVNPMNAVGGLRQFNSEMKLQRALASASGEQLTRLGAASAAFETSTVGAVAMARGFRDRLNEMQAAAAAVGEPISRAEAGLRALAERSPGLAQAAGNFLTVSNAARSMGDVVGAAARDSAEALGGRLNTAITNTGVKITEFPGQVASAMSTARTAIGVTALESADKLRNLASSAVEAGSLIGTRIGLGAIAAREALSNLGASARDAGSTIATGIGVAAINAREKLAGLRTTASEAGANLRSALTSAASAAGDGLMRLGSNAVIAGDRIANGFRDLPNKIGAGLAAIPERTRSVFSSMGDAAQSAFARVGGAVDGGIGHLSRFVGALGGVGAAAGTGLKLGLGSLVGFLGGPWGVALAAAGAALSILGAKQDEAKAKAQEHQAALDGLRGTLDKYSGAVTQATINEKASQLAKDGSLEKVKQLGVSTEDYTRATLGLPGALEAVNRQLQTHNVELIKGSDTYKRNGEALTSYGISLDDLAQAAAGNPEAMGRVQAGMAGINNEMEKSRVGKIVGEILQMGEGSKKLAAELGISTGEFQKLQEQQRLASEAAGDFTAKLDFVKGGLQGIAGGAAITEGLAKQFSSLGASASQSATGAGQAEAALRGVDSGAIAARNSMQGSRDAFLAAADAAHVPKEAAEALANQIGLIPSAAETIFRTNATGVQAEMITLGAQINAVPAGKDVKVNALTQEAQANLSAMGFQVEKLPDGTFRIFANTDEARNNLNNTLATANASTANVQLGANNAGAIGTINATVGTGNGSSATMTFNANGNPATGTINTTASIGNQTVATMTLAANNNPATGKITYTVQYANGSTGTITVNANDGAALAAIRNLQRTTHSSHIIDVYTRGGGGSGFVGNGAGGRMNASGGILQPMHDGGVLGFARGGFAGSKKLTPMRSGVAEMVKPNTWRVVGDRMKDDEAFIPINRSTRSRAIFEETARRMGYAVARQFADGGVATGNARRVARVTSDRNTRGFDGLSSMLAKFGQFNADFLQRVLSEASREVHVNMVANNPIAEPTSATVTRNLRKLSQMGAFG